MSVVSATILSNGRQIDPVYELLSIDVRRDVNRIPQANLVFVDGDAAKQTFPVSDARDFEPGTEIEIKLRYESEQDATVFKGPVVRHGIEADAQGSLLRIEMRDAAVKLTQARKSMVFVDKDDATVIGDLVKRSGLKSGTIEATRAKHRQIVQYYCTDWDFIVSRAESQGLLVVAEDGSVSARKADVSKPSTFSFEYGISEVYDFEFEVDAGSQYEKVQSLAWDVQQQKLTAAANAKPFPLEQGNLDGAKIAGALGFGPLRLSHPAPVVPNELQAWADGRLMRSRLSMIRGRFSTLGVPTVKLLDVIDISGVGARFNGKALVTGLAHRVDAGEWRTDIQFGLSAREFAREDAIRDVPAAGLLPAVSGLQIGVVDSFEEDPDKEFRVKVLLPGIDEKAGSVWARLASPDAGKDRGWFFRPETGDEVVVGFFNDDPRQPVILGALFGSKNAPPKKVSEITKENKAKGLVTKAGTIIGFTDDKKASIFIETAGGARVLLDDDAKSIALSDQNGNKLVMDKDGITITSGKDLKLDASGNVEIKGAKVDVK